MKVTMIGTLPPIKGISAYCLDLANSLSKKVELEFITFKKLYPEAFYPGGKVEDETSKIMLRAKRNFEIKDILTYYNPFNWLWVGIRADGEIFHIHWWTTFLTPLYAIILLAAKCRRKKIVITAHNILPHETYKTDRILTRMIFSFADKIIVHSDANINQCIDELEIPRAKIEKIPHGILSSAKIVMTSKSDARKKLSIPLDSKVVLYFGNIRKYKGLDVLIKAFSIIAEKYDNVILVIAGKPWEDWGRYDALIRKFGLTAKIRLFLDYVPQTEIEDFFSASDLVVLPYREFTSQSGVGMLALPYHKPLLVTDVGGLPELVLDNNFIVPPDDPQFLAEKVNIAINNPDVLTKLSKDSEELADKFSWNNISEKTVKVYEEVLRCP